MFSCIFILSFKNICKIHDLCYQYQDSFSLNHIHCYLVLMYFYWKNLTQASLQLKNK